MPQFHRSTHSQTYISLSIHGFIYELQINYPAAATEIAQDGIDRNEGNMKRCQSANSSRFSAFRFGKREVQERRKNIMMFEFEKIELIDGRWEEEIDQIRF